MADSSKGKVKVAIIETQLQEAFRHLEVLNAEHGQIRDSVKDLEVRAARIEQRIDEVNSKLNDNTLLTKYVWGTLIVGFVAAFIFKAIG